MTHLYLVRHCETRELAGDESPHPRGDSVLSARGEAQARELADFLRSHPVEIVLTSLFLRAQQTAHVIAAGSIPVRASMALNEFQLRDDGTGVETTEQGLVRSLGFLNAFRPYHAHIAVVGHNSLLSVLRMSLLNAPFDENRGYFSAPGQCCILRYDWRLGDQNWRETASFCPSA